MSSDDRPIAYVETNWLVALSFPHDQLFRRARRLLEDSANGRCEIRIPFAALLEAPHRMARKSQELTKAIADLKNMLAVAVQNGVSALGATIEALDAPDLEAYARNAPATTDETMRASAATVMPFEPTVIDKMEALRGEVRHGGGDTSDLAILAMILVDRSRQDQTRPAILFSTNTAEFDPRAKRSKLPVELLARNGIVFDEDFDLVTATGRWHAKFAAAAPSAG